MPTKYIHTRARTHTHTLSLPCHKQSHGKRQNTNLITVRNLYINSNVVFKNLLSTDILWSSVDNRIKRTTTVKTTFNILKFQSSEVCFGACQDKIFAVILDQCKLTHFFLEMKPLDIHSASHSMLQRKTTNKGSSTCQSNGRLGPLSPRHEH